MSVLSGLTPKNVFTYFEEICGIPHGSGNTQQISDYCVSFAVSHGLRHRQEPCGNVIIWKDASPGCEDAPAVMLQGHMDMVAVRTDDCPLDLETEGIRPLLRMMAGGCMPMVLLWAATTGLPSPTHWRFWRMIR